MSHRSRILVVEDDPLVCEVLSAALDETYGTISVGTSGAALDRLRSGGISLMLLDCTLPDGVDARLIPEAEKSGVPVILMSGDPARAETLADQPRPFVMKPFTIDTLLTTVEDVMRPRAAAG